MFFSASETAVTCFGELRARQLKEEGGFEGRVLATWVDRPMYVLSTILFGNNVVNSLLATVIAGLTARHLGSGEYSSWSVPVAAAGSTGLLLIFGEITPKGLGRVYAREITVPALWILDKLGKIVFPFSWALDRITGSIVGRAAQESKNSITVDELDYLIRVGEREGSIRAEQAAMLQGVFRFEDKIVRDIMVPLDHVTAVDLSWDLARIKAVAKRTGHSRLPVYVGDLDNIRGVLHIKELIHADGDGPDPRYLERLIRPALFVSESLLIHDLMRQLKERRVHLGVVVDDAGSMVGVVTLEDVLEQIVGKIFDESDRDPRQAQPERHGVFYVGGQESLARIEELFSVDFPAVDGADSVGDLLARLAGQIPTAGSVFVWENVRFKVLSANPKRILRVSAERVELENGDDD
jgi:CBS domain containing-hemolysin-like protein